MLEIKTDNELSGRAKVVGSVSGREYFSGTVDECWVYVRVKTPDVIGSRRDYSLKRDMSSILARERL